MDFSAFEYFIMTGPDLKESVTPVPPPRKRKRGRPLSPKPDGVTENHRHVMPPTPNDEPLYSSMQTPKSTSNYLDSESCKTDSRRTFRSLEDWKNEVKKLKEVYEHEVRKILREKY